MRLIDADALKEAFGECPYNWTDSPEEIQAVRDWDNAVDTIDSMTTIDAIPVEWLRNVHKNWILTRDDMEFRDWLIERWQKDQEAR